MIIDNLEDFDLLVKHELKWTKVNRTDWLPRAWHIPGQLLYYNNNAAINELRKRKINLTHFKIREEKWLH